MFFSPTILYSYKLLQTDTTSSKAKETEVSNIYQREEQAARTSRTSRTETQRTNQTEHFQSIQPGPSGSQKATERYYFYFCVLANNA